MSTRSVTSSAERPEHGRANSVLPVHYTASLGVWMTLLVAAFTLIASMAGILSPDRFYPAGAFKTTTIANDIHDAQHKVWLIASRSSPAQRSI